MTEAVLVSNAREFGHIFLAGIQASFTIVSAYVVALYFFLGRAPFLMKLLAFGFFSATLALLGLFAVGVMLYADGLAIGLGEVAAQQPLSTLGRTLNWLVNHELAYWFTLMSFIVGCGVYVALFYLTFLYNWRRDVVA